MAQHATTYFDGGWHEGNPLIMGPMTHAVWLSSLVFDGARGFEGVAPDLDLHCQRAVRSARHLGLHPTVAADEIEALAREAMARLPAEIDVYIRPMFWAESGWVDADPTSTRFCISVYESPIPRDAPNSACFSDLRRPSPEMAPTHAKAACHYPQASLAIQAAKARGFANAILCDPVGNIAEFATANIMLGKDGVVHTPAPNGTFLAGITRRRVLSLLRADGVEVQERALTRADVEAADEVFSTGNYCKLQPYTKIEDRELQPGPLYRRALDLYWDYAHQR